MNKLPHKFPNSFKLTILGNEEILGKFQNIAQKPVSFLEMKTWQKAKKLQKNSHWTFYKKSYFNWFRKSVPNIFRLIEVMATNEKFTRELVIVENVNFNIENHIVTLKKLQVKA